VVVPILKQGPEMHQGQRLWMLAGTGEGPMLAAQLLQRGWRLQVSLVSSAAALAYRPLLQGHSGQRLQLVVGALDGAQAVAAVLQQARSQGDPFAAVVDATHPFAQQISPALSEACAAAALPLLRLQRESLNAAGATVLPQLDHLAGVDLAGVSLLLAVGGRQLAAAVAHSPNARHHARVLPTPRALQQALAAGLEPLRLACLRPSTDFSIETALVRQWGIEVILCRQSGGLIEAGWQQVSQRCGCRLLLLQRPLESATSLSLPLAGLLAKLDGLIAAAGHD